MLLPQTRFCISKAKIINTKTFFFSRFFSGTRSWQHGCHSNILISDKISLPSFLRDFSQNFLHCLSFHTSRQTLLNNIRNIDKQILSHGEDQVIQTFLNGNTNYNSTVVKRLKLKRAIEYLISTERFKCSLFNY